MAAPKTPNVTNAAAARRRIGDDAAAARLREAGWTVNPPTGKNREDLPTPPIDALRSHQALMNDLYQWAPTVHRLVKERIAALTQAYGRFDHPLETPEEHAARVLAHGQNPFPAGVSIYEDLDDNRGYDHIGIGLEGDGELRITFTGWYPHWSAASDDEEEDYERRPAEIHCPGWLVAEPDGIDRYRAQTDQMVADVKREVSAEDAAVLALLDAV